MVGVGRLTAHRDSLGGAIDRQLVRARRVLEERERFRVPDQDGLSKVGVRICARHISRGLEGQTELRVLLHSICRRNQGCKHDRARGELG